MVAKVTPPFHGSFYLPKDHPLHIQPGMKDITQQLETVLQNINIWGTENGYGLRFMEPHPQAGTMLKHEGKKITIDGCEESAIKEFSIDRENNKLVFQADRTTLEPMTEIQMQDEMSKNGSRKESF